MKTLFRSYGILVLIPLLAGWVLLLLNFTRLQASDVQIPEEKASWWDLRSVDTMKLSRDLAREKLSDPTFDAVIDVQIQAAADVGATHLGIGTPYDDEFIPFMQRWVTKAREKGLKIWFRGNFSGWEQWFDYPLVTREQHISQLQRFILNNQALFEDGDLFTSCPECENGGAGDPRRTGDVEGYRKFLIDEYAMAKKSFATIRKDVQSNLYSMNGDVALLVMDPETTKALDGIITVDHYVKDAQTMERDLKIYSEKSGGKVVLGEFGAPIPDIHGNVTEERQAQLLDSFFDVFTKNESVIGVNYWVLTDGSTELVSIEGKRREGLSVLERYFTATESSGFVHDELGNPLSDIQIQTSRRTVLTDSEGFFRLPIKTDGEIATISGALVEQQTATLSSTPEGNIFVLTYVHESFVFKLLKFIFMYLPVFHRQMA